MSESHNVKPTNCIYETGLRYVLRLHLSEISSRSYIAIMKIRRICEEELRGFFELDVIYQRPEEIGQELILTTPIMMRRLPSPLNRLVDDLSKIDSLIVGLEIVPR